MPGPVGFFDSGVGGLTVLEAAKNKLPSLPFVYFGDTAHCPYGDRPLEQVKQFALDAVDFLAQKEADPIVMACNISSSVALEQANERYPDRTILGLINGALVEEIQARSQGVVGVMATAGTVQSQRYPQALDGTGLTVYQQACSPLVPLVEEGHYTGEIVQNTLEPLVEPLRGQKIDTLILGCTHYPLLIPALRRCFDESVEIIDPGQVMARELKRRLSASNGQTPTEAFYTSGDTGSVEQALTQDFDYGSPDVTRVRLSPSTDREPTT